MKKYILTTCLICLVALFCSAQKKETKNDSDTKQETLKFELKNDANPDVYIDGKKYDYEIVDLLDKEKIESISVVKGEEAKEKYNAPNGVLLIKTNPKEEEEDNKVHIRGTGPSNDSNPTIIIDGKKSTKDALSEIDPESIESINVIKGEDAEKEYNSPNGVIVVTLKKKKK